MAPPSFSNAGRRAVAGLCFFAGFITCALLVVFMMPLILRSPANTLHSTPKGAGVVAETSRPEAQKKQVIPAVVVPAAELVQIIPSTGQTIPIHPFFISFIPKGTRSPGEDGPTWTIPKAVDFDKSDFRQVCNSNIHEVLGKIGQKFIRHRKMWEFYYVYKTLTSMGVVGPGKSGVAFGVGKEPLPSAFAALGAHVLGTDMPPEGKQASGWAEGNQYAAGKEALFKSELISHAEFEKLVSFQHVDMNNIPPEWAGKFDFVWSSCSMEHVGSLELSKAFFINTLKLLRPGGVTLHTTELMLSHLDEVTSGHTSIWRYKDLVDVHNKALELGFEVFPIDVRIGEQQLDQYIDFPPYTPDTGGDNHLKIAIGKFATTSVGLIARRPL